MKQLSIKTSIPTDSGVVTARVPMTPFPRVPGNYFRTNKRRSRRPYVIAFEFSFMAIFANFVHHNSPSDQYRDALCSTSVLEGETGSFVLEPMN